MPKRLRSEAAKAQSRVKAKEWAKRNPERMRAIRFREHLKSRYGLTWEQYEKLSESQDHVCAICLKPCSVRDRLVVDHCHKLGTVRGLLCELCNLGVGALRDDPKRLRAAAIYVENRTIFGVTDVIGEVHDRTKRARKVEK